MFRFKLRLKASLTRKFLFFFSNTLKWNNEFFIAGFLSFLFLKNIAFVPYKGFFGKFKDGNFDLFIL